MLGSAQPAGPTQAGEGKPGKPAPWVGPVPAALMIALGFLAGSTINDSRLSRAAHDAPTPMDGGAARLAASGFAAIVRRVSPVVVEIQVAVHDQRSDDDDAAADTGAPQCASCGGDGRPLRMPGHGSGFVVRSDGVIVTNEHVVRNAARITVTMADGRDLPARILGRDPMTDLAVLKVEPDSALPTGTWADSDTAHVGDWVVAIGNPHRLSGTVTAGIVSARDRDLGFGPYNEFLQIDAPLNRGNSGGPLFDMHGRIIGVNSANVSPTGSSIGLGFAIPANRARRIVERLVADGEIDRGFLGVMTKSIGRAAAPQFATSDGALVVKVEWYSPAARAGLRPGDIITQIDGVAVRGARGLARILGDHRPGESIRISVHRDRTDIVLDAVLARQADGPANGQVSPLGGRLYEDAEGLSIGAGLIPVDKWVLSGNGRPTRWRGVGVLWVMPASAAERAQLQPGDLIVRAGDEAVLTPADVARAVASSRRRRLSAVTMRVMRQGRPMIVSVSLRDDFGTSLTMPDEPFAGGTTWLRKV